MASNPILHNLLKVDFGFKYYYEIDFLNWFVVAQLDGGWQLDYSTKTTQAVYLFSLVVSYVMTACSTSILFS